MWEPARKEIRKKIPKTLDHLLRILEGQVRVEEDERAEQALARPLADRRSRSEEPRRENYMPKMSRREWINNVAAEDGNQSQGSRPPAPGIDSRGRGQGQYNNQGPR